ncbi:hypothetical protein KAR91_50595 [Candidatus Pacearchaeota archaeon]|nr:hypothetical protein [Candidatus Pacearchaeota archaeon]
MERFEIKKHCTYLHQVVDTLREMPLKRILPPGEAKKRCARLNRWWSLQPCGRTDCKQRLAI